MSEDFQTQVLDSLKRLESKVDALQKDVTDHRRGTSDSFARVLKMIQALHAERKDSPGPLRAAK